MLDLGGGEGVFIAQVAARYPRMRFTLMDLPAVTRRAATWAMNTPSPPPRSSICWCFEKL
ncbi:MAG: hypothetical protein EBX65_02120 [Betaproteobacteria bacterium]|nr:hypothetical protein [Betaproteobacteria bacterium]